MCGTFLQEFTFFRVSFAFSLWLYCKVKDGEPYTSSF